MYLLTIRETNCRYMKQRITLEKVNAAINDMATYAEATSQLLTAPRKKVAFWSIWLQISLETWYYSCADSYLFPPEAQRKSCGESNGK